MTASAQLFVKRERKPIEAASKFSEHVSPDVMSKLMRLKQELLSKKPEATTAK